MIFQLVGSSKVVWSRHNVRLLLNGLDPFGESSLEGCDPVVTTSSCSKDLRETWLPRWRIRRRDFEAWYVTTVSGLWAEIGKFWPARTIVGNPHDGPRKHPRERRRASPQM